MPHILVTKCGYQNLLKQRVSNVNKKQLKTLKVSYHLLSLPAPIKMGVVLNKTG